jgi:hypothetical protein
MSRNPIPAPGANESNRSSPVSSPPKVCALKNATIPNRPFRVAVQRYSASP